MMPSAAEKTGLPKNMQENTPPNIPVLVAVASILQISETLLPHPIPGLRFGFANIVSLIILVQYGFKPALIVTLLRTVVSSFLLGSFLSPGFILSFSGGLASICVTGILYWMSKRFHFFNVSPVGLGMAGAFIHNMVQIYMAYLILIRLPQIFFLVPWLGLGAVVLGAFSGSLASGILKALNLKKQAVPIPYQPVTTYENMVYKPGVSLLHKTGPEIKIILVLGVTLLVVLKENLVLYAFLFAGILLLISASGLRYTDTFQIIKKIRVIIVSSSFLPLYFNPGNQVLVETRFFSIHLEAVTAGVVFGSRIILLALISSILAQTTGIDAFTAGIKRFLKPLDRFGMDSDYIARTISTSMVSLPSVWSEIRWVIRFLLKGKKHNFNTLKEVVNQLFVYIFSGRNNRP